MHETVLRDFFAGLTDVAALREDLIGTLTVAEDSLEYDVVKMAEPFRVTPKHLVRLCEAITNNSLPPEVLQPIGLCVIASDHFAWADTATGDLVAETLNDWASPETNYPLTPTTVKLFRERLLTGKDVLKTRPLN
jgi:hypothetical protein